jgi:hypothetical protein
MASTMWDAEKERTVCLMRTVSRGATTTACRKSVVDPASKTRARQVDYAQFKHEKNRTIQRVTVQSQEALDLNDVQDDYA